MAGIVEQTNSSQEQKQQGQQTETGRGKLVQRLLAAGGNLPAFVSDLVNTQAMVVAGTEAVAFMIEPDGETFRLQAVVHLRPDHAGDDVRKAAINAFSQIVRPCVEQNREGAFEVGAADDAGELQYCLATLLRSEGRAVGVTAVITRCLNLDRARQRLASMELVAGYFELLSIRRAADQARQVATSHQGVLQLLGSVSTVDGFEAGARNLSNELATRTGASRVALGWLKGQNIQVKALSHTEKFDKKQELIQHIQRVMEECLDQDQIVHFDPRNSGTDNVKREAESYSRANGNCSVLSAPLRHAQETVGVLMLEFPVDREPDPASSTLVAIASDVLAPQLYDRHENDHYIFVKIGHSIQALAKKAVGPQHTLVKLVTVGVMLATVLLFVIRPTYRVSASFQFAALQRQSLVAPAKGFIGKLAKIDGETVRPGMDVTAGQKLATLDTTELELRQNEARSRANAQMKEAQQKRQEGKTAEANIAMEQAKAAQAEADLLTWQIERSAIVSPLAGQIIRGDLRDRVGASVEVGDVLFEVADPNQLEVEMTVAERDIQLVQVGQKGEVATTGRPDQTHPFVVTRVVPLGEPKDAANVFRVYGKLDSSAPYWRPGMQGEARIAVGPRSVAWIWTHRLIDFLRLKLWW